MDIITLIGTAFALAMDAFAVAVAAGVSSKQISFRQTFRLAWHFGFFQFMMPVIGWFFYQYNRPFCHIRSKALSTSALEITRYFF
jgi:putative Mn2+ efflux pump MntP